MPFWDFLFPERLKERREKEERRATKERRKKREREKSKEKGRSREPVLHTAEPLVRTRPAAAAAASPKAATPPPAPALTGSLDIRSTLPKSESAKEETSAMAASSEPIDENVKHPSWEYADDTDKEGGMSKKLKDFTDKSVRRVRAISERSKRSSKIQSRPIKEKTLDRFMERVKARQESRNRSAEKIARDSECVFPSGAEAVRAEAIVAKKKDEVGSSREKRSDRSNRDKDDRIEEETPPSKSPSASSSPKRRTRKKEKSPSGSKSSKEARSPKDTSSKRRSKEARSKEKKRQKEKDKKKDKDDDDFPDSARSERSARSDKSDKSSRRARASPLKQIQKIFPDLSKKGRQERREAKEQKRKEKEESRRRAALFVNGRPFWVNASKVSAAEKAEMTQDDLPMNAAIILEVRKGNIDLPVLPSTIIKFDPWAPLEELQARDETLFNHKMLFANTIRSMINSSDFTGTDGTTGDGVTGETPERKVKHIEFSRHPTFYYTYDRSNPSKVWREVFRWEGQGVA